MKKKYLENFYFSLDVQRLHICRLHSQWRERGSEKMRCFQQDQVWSGSITKERTKWANFIISFAWFLSRLLIKNCVYLRFIFIYSFKWTRLWMISHNFIFNKSRHTLMKWILKFLCFILSSIYFMKFHLFFVPFMSARVRLLSVRLMKLYILLWLLCNLHIETIWLNDAYRNPGKWYEYIF